MFFRMRRQHAFELNKSLKRAIKERDDSHPSSKNRPSGRGNNEDAPAEKRDGDDDGAADAARGEQAFVKQSFEHETEGVRRRGASIWLNASGWILIAVGFTLWPGVMN